jgi:hypothetical protein
MVDVLKVCPELVLGKYLVVTSFDSGPLRLTATEFETGWLQHDELAINPSVRSVKDIPCDEYDEWFIFSSTPMLEGFKVFVNYGSFSLRDPQSLIAGAESPDHHTGIKYAIETLEAWQELFWLQLELKAAETYVASGDRFILATQDQALYEKFARSLRDANNGARRASSIQEE